jgi:hypothetical protein
VELQVKGNEFRFFWFSGDLFQESLRQAGRKKQDRLEWERSQMAVPYNWSLCDKLARIHLHRGDKILAIEATGLPCEG